MSEENDWSEHIQIQQTQLEKAASGATSNLLKRKNKRIQQLEGEVQLQKQTNHTLVQQNLKLEELHESHLAVIEKAKVDLKAIRTIGENANWNKCSDHGWPEYKIMVAISDAIAALNRHR